MYPGCKTTYRFLEISTLLNSVLSTSELSFDIPNWLALTSPAMHIILYLFGLVYCVSSISIQPTFRSSRLKARSNPSFIGDNKNLPKLQDDSSQGGIAKRTDPTFYNGDYGKTTEGTDRKSLLEDAFPDVYTLVLTALNHWDDVIFDHWFPPRDKAKVENVLTSIINSQVSTFVGLYYQT